MRVACGPMCPDACHSFAVVLRVVVVLMRPHPALPTLARPLAPQMEAAALHRLAAAYPPRADVDKPKEIPHGKIAAVLVPLFLRPSQPGPPEGD